MIDEADLQPDENSKQHSKEHSSEKHELAIINPNESGNHNKHAVDAEAAGLGGHRIATVQVWQKSYYSVLLLVLQLLTSKSTLPSH